MLESPQGLRAALEYNADLFEPGTISRLFGCFQTLLESIAGQPDRPDRPMAQLELLTPAERHQLIAGWNQTWSDYPRDRTIPRLFEEQALRSPQAIAVSFEGRTLTYEQLDERANQLAHRLQRAGVGADTLVGLCLDRSVELIVALLGILKAGGAYVSLDPAYPAERLAFMLADSRAPVLLIQEKHRATVDAFLREQAATAGSPRVDIIALDAEWEAIAAEPDTTPVACRWRRSRSMPPPWKSGARC
jgi:non-ribosomal peptide synthetase component F